jgi:predicted nucleic acid-binding protein
VITIDASAWISSQLPDDAAHLPSRQWLDRWLAAGQPLLAPSLLAIEVAGAIARRTGDPALGRQAVEHLRATPNLHLVIVDDPLADAASAIAADLRLRGADALYVAVAQLRGTPLLTWDQQQLTRAASLIAVRTPLDPA